MCVRKRDRERLREWESERVGESERDRERERERKREVKRENEKISLVFYPNKVKNYPFHISKRNFIT